ncbi:MAG: chemotaxis-specific protein-glutamate methyltransferase CheB [Caldilineaceae bacterium]|nr:chemotaxis-specific protein-glutamate methyltransferase CheB [Caldilineaceae bacterium]
MIRVLIVEDSATARDILIHILSTDPDIQVVGTAYNGEEALSAVQQWQPDLVTMDIHMPRLNGFDATRRIMESCPIPIVIISGSWEANGATILFQALAAGALTALPQPRGITHPQFAESAHKLRQTVKMMAAVKVIRRWPHRPHRTQPTGHLLSTGSLSTGSLLIESLSTESLPIESTIVPRDVRIVAIGASTGGPAALQAILGGLPQRFTVPLVIVQHMAVDFIQGLVEWLAQSSHQAIHIAEHGQPLLPGHIYVAPDNYHLTVTAGERIALLQDAPEHGMCPSVARLFRSVAAVYQAQAVGVLLTGMGKDGAAELKLLRECGAITIAQDRQSSVVYGMPGEAMRLNAATHILSLQEIVAMLALLVKRN